MDDTSIFEMQRLYPQIYLACHADHVRAASTRWRISSRDASILAHLEMERGIGPRALAVHLGVVPSTLSASLKRLERLGYITNTQKTDDKRKREIRLTERGAEAMASTSVLDAGRVGHLLEKLSAADRKKAINGLAMLARAARTLMEDEKK